MSKNEAGDAGFTLLEVLTAFAILGLAFGVSVAVIGPSLTRLRADAEERSATMYAESMLARVGADIPLVDGRLTGTDGELIWTIVIAPTAPPDQGAELIVVAPLHGHDVSVSVSWSAGSKRREFAIRTLKLGTKP